MPVSGINCLLLDCVCWDKDRFGKDYLGEFELALEDIFANGKMEQMAKWHPLKDKRASKKASVVSGEVQLQFTLYDAMAPGSTCQQVMEKFWAIAGIEPEGITLMKVGGRESQGGDDDDDDDDLDQSEEPSDETEDPSKPETVEKRKRRMRIRGLKKRKAHQLYEFSGDSDMVGIVFLEIGKVTDLPPEKNLTRTSFDMDPFVVASLGKKTYRTRVIRHCLNPIFNEKMIFQVLRHEQSYSIAFTVIDRDKLSGNDFIASASVPLQEITDTAPKANPETGLYDLRDPPDSSTLPGKSKTRFKLPLSRSSSSQSLSKLSKPAVAPKSPSHGPESLPTLAAQTSYPANLQPGGDVLLSPVCGDAQEGAEDRGDPDLHSFTIPLKLKNLEKWEDKHSPELIIRAKYVPYPALRQQFWRAMLKQYDTDESGRISKIELTTMLDTLGSTLKESTIDSFFKRFPHGSGGDDNGDLTYDEAVICLEDQLQIKCKQPVTDRVKDILPSSATIKSLSPPTFGRTDAPSSTTSSVTATGTSTPVELETASTREQSQIQVNVQSIDELGTAGEEGEYLDRDDLNDRGEEHVVEIRECPICHQPRLNRRSDADIITHIATCASQDWRQVNNIVMAGFVTPSQAQRKWYSKVITKISYGGYKLGANSANILVQDRITGQINEERMSIYVRLGIRLLYKGLKSREMEKKRSMICCNICGFRSGPRMSIANQDPVRKLLRGLSIKQGIKYDDPASKNEIQKFIQFHQLDMSEVLLPIDAFRNFNEFFYRELKPNARPCSAPDNPLVIVSPADCRSVVFNKIDEATKIWIKGREFSIERLLGKQHQEDAKMYANGALGIFRLAPQDYHRFHIPVDGVMGTPTTIEGEYYTVNPMAIRSALDVYGENVRVIVPIDSVAHGRVTAICVGAMMVGSTVITRKPGENVKRAEELGYFKFGGSTIILLFEPGMMKFDEDLADNSNGALETLVCSSRPFTLFHPSTLNFSIFCSPCQN
jgi:phosphatidylserine decarboxylase